MAAVHPITPFGSGFEITFMCMGQGDSCVIRCPDGEIILIDCGSTKDFTENERARAVLTLRKYCTGRLLHSLILTHSDGDHYNRVKGVIGSVGFKDKVEFEFDGQIEKFPYTAVEVKIKNIFFSDMLYASLYRDKKNPESFKNYSHALNKGPLQQYYDSGASNFLYEALVNPLQINLVHLDGGDDEHILSWTWVETSIKGNNPVKRAPKGTLAGHGVETVHEGDGWSVKILAGDVAKTARDQSDVSGCNAGSLVTLLQIGKRKCLICGDATVSTEAVLLQKFGNAIQGVEILQAPHHGSGLTSSSIAFVTTTAPSEVVMSVARFETGYHLPSLDVVQKYRDIAIDLTDEETLVVDGWTICKDYKKGWDETEAYVMADNFMKEYEVKPDSRKLYVLPDDVIDKLLKGTKAPVCIAVMPSSGYMLYRQTIRKEVYQTGLEGADPFIVLKLDKE